LLSRIVSRQGGGNAAKRAGAPVPAQEISGVKKELKALKHLAEYACLRLLVFMVRVLPLGVALAMGWGLAWIGFHVAGFRVRTAKTRIREVFGAVFTPGEIRRIAWISWRNFIFGMIDLVKASAIRPEQTWAAIETNDSVQKILVHLRETGLGAIIAIPHMGAWEMSAFAAAAHGIPLFTIAARQKNRRADEFMNRMRQTTGIETVLRDSSALRGIIRRIRDGKVLAILPDLRSPQSGLNIRFLGKTANIAGGMGFIARQTGVPVFPVVITRSGWKRHVCRIYDPIKPDPGLDKQADALRITQAVFDVFNECIRAEPEQWFWFNKRWLFDPLDPPSNAD